MIGWVVAILIVSVGFSLGATALLIWNIVQIRRSRRSSEARSGFGAVAKAWFVLASFGLMGFGLLALATPAAEPYELVIAGGLVARSSGTAHFPWLLFVGPLVAFAFGAIARWSRGRFHDSAH
jgi:hypothetical protein